MNNLDLLKAPIYTFFSLEFYRQALRQPVSKGFLYLLYLTVIASVAFLILMNRQFLPQAETFIDWAKAEAPVLTWTPAGLTMEDESPYQMTHPELGVMAVFDMKAETVTAKDMGNVPVYVTAGKLYLQEGSGRLRVYDLVPPELKERKDLQPVRITGEFYEQMFNRFKPWIVVLGTLFFGLTFYLLRILQGLVLSLLGLVFNSFRKQKVSYGSLLTVSFFAMTPFLALELLRILVPAAGFLPTPVWMNMIISGIYLFIAVMMTEDKRLSINPPAA